MSTFSYNCCFKFLQGISNDLCIFLLGSNEQSTVTVPLTLNVATVAVTKVEHLSTSVSNVVTGHEELPTTYLGNFHFISPPCPPRPEYMTNIFRNFTFHYRSSTTGPSVQQSERRYSLH